MKSLRPLSFPGTRTQGDPLRHVQIQRLQPEAGLKSALDGKGQDLPGRIQVKLLGLIRLAHQPGIEPLVLRRGHSPLPTPDITDPASYFLPVVLILSSRNHDDRWSVGDVSVHGMLGAVPEESHHRVIVFGRDGIEFMVVASGARHCQTQPYRSRSCPPGLCRRWPGPLR